MTSLRLTTVEQPIRRMGHDALAMLVRLIRGEPVEETHPTMATRLVVRHPARAI
jgi:LacI family transcriptional regulator